MGVVGVVESGSMSCVYPTRVEKSADKATNGGDGNSRIC